MSEEPIRELPRYGLVGYGINQHPNGEMLHLPDVVKMLEHILDDDKLAVERAARYRQQLRKGG
jgi:hypothetical protein